MVARPATSQRAVDQYHCELDHSKQTDGMLSRYHGQNISGSSVASFGIGHESTSTTPVGRREAARQLFDQYGISRPSGWLSGDGDDLSLEVDGSSRYRKSQRICHVCGDRIIPQAFCPSCGHPLCGECRRLNSSTSGHAHASTAEIRHGHEEVAHDKAIRILRAGLEQAGTDSPETQTTPSTISLAQAAPMVDVPSWASKTNIVVRRAPILEL